MDNQSQAGLLGRLDVLTNLVAERGGLPLDCNGHLANQDARLIAEALDLRSPPALPARDLAAVDLLRGLAEMIGLLRVRAGRIQATTLRHPWAKLEPDVRAGLTFAAWCHRCPWIEMLGDCPNQLGQRLWDARRAVLRLLYQLPADTDIDLHVLAATVADDLGPPQHEDRVLLRAIAAVFLDPLAALGAAQVTPSPPEVPTRARLAPSTKAIIGSALVAGGDDKPLDRQIPRL